MNESGARVVVTGGAGFLGDMVARRLLASGEIEIDGCAFPLSELVLMDVCPPRDDLARRDDVRVLVGDLGETLSSLEEFDLVFHLAGVVSGAAEVDFDLGMNTNLYALIALLEHARKLETRPVVVFTSSLAVFGQDPDGPLLGTVDDDTLPRPQSSYGVQKFVGEQLLADYTRRGYVRGRSLRLMTVSVRPGAANAAASSFLSGMIREPLAGERSVCPVPADTPVALSSPSRTVDGILRAAAVDATLWGSRTAMNLPALTTTPRQMADALEVIAPGRSELIDWAEDPSVIDIIATWPAKFVTRRAERLGLYPASSFREIVEEYINENVSV